jgi:hypothetical protein
VPAQSDILGAAKRMMTSLGKLIAAKAEEALARSATEAKAGTRVQRATIPQSTNAVPSPPKRRLWPWLAGALGLLFFFSFMGLCMGVTVVGLGIRSISRMDWKLPASLQGSATHRSLHATEHQVLNPMLKDGRHNLLDGSTGFPSWTPVPKQTGDQSDSRVWSYGRNRLIIKGPPEDITRITVILHPNQEDPASHVGVLCMMVGLQQGLLSPDRFDQKMAHDFVQWMTEQASRRKEARAAQEVGDVAIVYAVRIEGIFVQFRHRSAPDDFTVPE